MTSPDQVIDLMRATLWLTIEIGAPVMLVALGIGVAVGLLQALTSLQEMTLTFVPKLLVVVGAVWYGLGSMHDVLAGFLHGPLLAAMLSV